MESGETDRKKMLPVSKNHTIHIRASNLEVASNLGVLALNHKVKRVDSVVRMVNRTDSVVLKAKEVGSVVHKAKIVDLVAR